MFKIVITIYLSLLIPILCSSQNGRNDYLVKIYEGKYDEVGTKCGYINEKGDTVIKLGKYYYCYSDTIYDFGIVMTNNNRLIGIDKNETELFEIYITDNGPDFISEGLFRIVIDQRIGYANSQGKIIIKPMYKCAFPFQNGRAKVSNHCINKNVGEYHEWVSDKWIYIDKDGNQINTL